MNSSAVNWLVGVDDLWNAIASEGLLKNLAGMAGLQRDGHLAQQVGIDLVLPMPLAGARLRAHGRDAHAQHQRAQVTAAYEDALASHYAAKHSGTHEGGLQMQLVDAAHQCQVSFAGGAAAVVHGASADLKQLGLAHHAQGVFTVNQRFALSNPALVSALCKKSFSSANWPILACSGARSTGSGAAPEPKEVARLV